MSATSTKKSLDGFDRNPPWFLVFSSVWPYLVWSFFLKLVCDSLYEMTIENTNIEMVDGRTLDFLYWAILLLPIIYFSPLHHLCSHFDDGLWFNRIFVDFMAYAVRYSHVCVAVKCT